MTVGIEFRFQIPSDYWENCKILGDYIGYSSAAPLERLRNANPSIAN